jgi:uncharacterized protein DUF1573
MMPHRSAKALVTLLVLAAGARCLAAADTPAVATAAAPKLVVDETRKEIGLVEHGDVLEHDFVLRNEGTAPLAISEVTQECPCFTVTFDKTIPPGASGKVHVRFDTQGYNGQTARSVLVHSNDPAAPRKRLTLATDIRSHVSMLPGYARFIYVQHEEVGTIAQTLWPLDGHDFKILEVKSPYPYLEVSFREPTESERSPEGKGRQWRVETRLKPDAAVGPLKDYVEIRTDHPRDRLIRLPVSGFVRPIFAVTPAKWDFGSLGGSNLTRRARFEVENFATQPIGLAKVETGIPGTSATIEPVTDGRRYNVILQLSPEMPKGPFQSRMRIYTASPQAPVLEVELTGIVL